MNCWEMFDCSVKEDCPAYPEHGSRCARVQGTLCRGKKQVMMSRKIEGCNTCRYYNSEHYDRTFQEFIRIDRAIEKLKATEEELQDRLASVEADIDKVLDLYQDGLIDKKKLAERIDPLNCKKQALLTKLDTLKVNMED